MKTFRFLGAGLAGLLVAAPLFAQTTAPTTTPAPPAAGSHKAMHREKMLRRFDTNGDGKLDESERAAMKQAKAARIKQFDSNGDGKLDANEKAARRAQRKAASKASGAATTEPVGVPKPSN